MRTIQLYATGSGTASAVAQVTIPTSGRIRGVQAAVVMDGTADNSRTVLQLSKVPSSQIATNGAQDPFLNIDQYANSGAAGFGVNGVNAFFPLDVPVRQGEIIYLHATVPGGTYYAHFILHYD